MTKKQDWDNQSSVTKQKEASTTRKIVFITISALIVIMLIIITSSFFYIKSAIGPVDKNNDEEIEVDIPLGSSTSDIATILEKEGLIKNSTIFKFYIKFKNTADFQAGNYTISPSQDIDGIIEELQSGKVMEEPIYKVTIPEGKSADQIGAILANKLDISEEEFLERLQDEELITSLQEEFPELITDELENDELLIPLEGYLYAGTYEIFEEDPSIDSLINMMVKQTNDVIASKQELIDKSDFTIHEILTLASIIERESKFDEDRPKVAQVFINRLDEDMKLQSDITAAYANREHKVLMSYDDIGTDSPYNTYVQEGMPPGPISSPSLPSIEAVLKPEGKEFTELYFYARPSGETFYRKTLEEHTKVKEEYEHEWHELNEEQKKAKEKAKDD